MTDDKTIQTILQESAARAAFDSISKKEVDLNGVPSQIVISGTTSYIVEPVMGDYKLSKIFKIENEDLAKMLDRLVFLAVSDVGIHYVAPSLSSGPTIKKQLENSLKVSLGNYLLDKAMNKSL